MIMGQLSEFGIVPTWDLGLVVFLFISILFYEISSGKSQILLTLLSTYFSFVTVNFFPFWWWLEEIFRIKEIFYFKILFFWALTLLFTVLLSRSMSGSFFSFTKIKIGHFLQAFLFSILQTGLLVSISFSFLPEKYYSNISPLVFAIFSKEFLKFLWVLFPIIALLILKKRGSDKLQKRPSRRA